MFTKRLKKVVRWIESWIDLFAQGTILGNQMITTGGIRM